MIQEKTLADVIEAVKSNDQVTDEELRMALLCLDSLMSLDFHAFMNLHKSEKENKNKRLVYSAVWQFENRFERIKRAMQQIPRIYVGENNSPSNPEYQKRREISNKIVGKILNNEEKNA